MAFIKYTDPQPITQVTLCLQQACDDYRTFITNILKPAKDDLEPRVSENKVALHQVFGANLILAHSVDYLRAVRSADGIEETRKELVTTFDEKFSVPGEYLRRRKMELADAINNAVKHIRIDPIRYKHLSDRYGQISFQSLLEDEGRVMCHLDDYRFDYCRVVLLPALRALSYWEFNSTEEVLEFARGGFAVIETLHHPDIFDYDDPSMAIDQMIELCSSPCKNCEEEADECRCSRYVFAGEYGRFEPLNTASESELEYLMNHISPSYSRA